MTHPVYRRSFLQAGLAFTGALVTARWQDWAEAGSNPAPQRIAQIEETCRDQYGNYFGRSRAAVRLPDEIIATLQRLSQETDSRLALVYLYPKVDGLEQILVRPGQPPYYYRQTDLPPEVLVKALDDYRDGVVRPFISSRFLGAAQVLYRRIIAPIQPLLQASQINTLIFCVGTQLRSTPLVGLHDGQRYLVEQYSLGLVPSFSLINTQFRLDRGSQILAMGASQFEDLNPLPAVPLELAAITQPPWQGQRFLNQNFTLKNLQQQLQTDTYRIVHLATHARFNPGVPSQSYIQLWQRDRLLLSQIASLDWRTLPVELLVLSACQTAMGDPQAELGFAGLAYESGVKTTLASLWAIGDLSTLALIREFYHHLADPNVKTKVEALRRAQMALLRGQVSVQNGTLVSSSEALALDSSQAQSQQVFTAPYHWAGFTLVGSPW